MSSNFNFFYFIRAKGVTGGGSVKPPVLPPKEVVGMKVWGVFRVVRTAHEDTDSVTLVFKFQTDMSWTTVAHIAEEVARTLKLPIDEVEEMIRTKWHENVKTSGLIISNKTTTVTIKKADAKETKKAIKEATRMVERFIEEVDKELQKLTEKYSVSEWLWKNAVYDPEKKKFVPSE